jgi:hypothetical protein
MAAGISRFEVTGAAASGCRSWQWPACCQRSKRESAGSEVALATRAPMTGSQHGQRHGPVVPAQSGGGRFQGELCSQRRPAPSLRNLGQHAPPGGVAALERVDAGGDECAVSPTIAGRSLLVVRNGNPGDRRGEESCLLSRIADQQVCYESAVSPGSPKSFDLSAPSRVS